LLGSAALVAFLVVERSRREPMLPLSLFRSHQFVGANLTTLAVYAGLGGAFFLVVLQLQSVLGYSALEAGASLLPVTILMLALSSRTGELAQRIGPRLPMTVGPLVVAAGLLLFRRIQPDATYFGAVVPAAAVFGAGLSFTVAPLTSAVLAAVDERHLGVASGVNNAVARLAGLLAVALLPAVAGLQRAGASPAAFSAGFARAMTVAAVVCALGGLIAFATVRRAAPVRTITQVSVHQPCHDPCVRAAASA
jgi:predicted MFS family arabinose efflux permease